MLPPTVAKTMNKNKAATILLVLEMFILQILSF